MRGRHLWNVRRQFLLFDSRCSLHIKRSLWWRLNRLGSVQVRQSNFRCHRSRYGVRFLTIATCFLAATICVLSATAATAFHVLYALCLLLGLVVVTILVVRRQTEVGGSSLNRQETTDQRQALDDRNDHAWKAAMEGRCLSGFIRSAKQVNKVSEALGIDRMNCSPYIYIDESYLALLVKSERMRSTLAVSSTEVFVQCRVSHWIIH